MPTTIKALRLHSLLLGGALTGPLLDEELSNPLVAGAFESSLRQRSVSASFKASATARLALAASATALAAVLRQDMSLLDALLADSAALGALFGTPASVAVVSVSGAALDKLQARLFGSEPATTETFASTTITSGIATSAPLVGRMIAAGAAVASALFSNQAALAAMLGTTAQPNYVARPLIWDSTVFSDALMTSATARTWALANAAISYTSPSERFSVSVVAKKTLVLQVYSGNGRAVTMSTLRAGGSSAGHTNLGWADVSYACNPLDVDPSDNTSFNIAYLRYLRMEA